MLDKFMITACQLVINSFFENQVTFRFTDYWQFSFIHCQYLDIYAHGPFVSEFGDSFEVIDVALCCSGIAVANPLCIRSSPCFCTFAVAVLFIEESSDL